MKKLEDLIIKLTMFASVLAIIMTTYSYYKHETDRIIFYGVMTILNYLICTNLINKAGNEK